MNLRIKKKRKQTAILIIFLLTVVPIFSLITLNTTFTNKTDNLTDENKGNNQNDIMGETPEPSVSFSNFEWWNDSWEFRVPVNISANGAEQTNVPIEYIMNFTTYFLDLDVSNPEMNNESIRVVEYETATEYVEIPSQFDERNDFDNQTNAVGDLVWIMNGTTSADETRNYFVYFNNGTEPSVPANDYDPIRAHHMGFEFTDKDDIESVGGTQDEYDTDAYQITDEVAGRGNRSLLITGNCWKGTEIGESLSTSNIPKATVKMRFEDPDIEREISGIGFWNQEDSLEESHSYNIRGNQDWGEDNSYYNELDDPTKFYWSYFDLTELGSYDMNHLVYIADDDDYTNVSLYWDDISLWYDDSVQTVAGNEPEVTSGDAEPISYTLEVTCIDIDGFRVPNAQVEVTNDSQPFLDKTGQTTESGTVLFSNMSRNGIYNITVNYTMDGINGETKIVYEKSNFQLDGLRTELTARLNLWTINFEISDFDTQPIKYGYVQLKNGTDTVGETTLTASGKGTIRWMNQSSYNYSVYYNYTALDQATSEGNKHYNRYERDNLLIYNDTIARGDANAPVWNVDSRDVNDLDPEIVDGSNVYEEDDLEEFSNKQISEFNVSALNVEDKILEFNVLGKIEGSWYTLEEYDYSEESKNSISYVYNSSVSEYQGPVQDIRVQLEKQDSSVDNGTIQFEYVLSTYVNNATKLSKINFDVEDTERDPFENAVLRFYNETDYPDQSEIIANITVNDEGTARFIALNNETANWGNYTFEVYFSGETRNFNETGEEVYSLDNMNVTLYQEMNIDLTVSLDLEEWKTDIYLTDSDPENLVDGSIFWRDNISVSLNFTTTDSEGTIDYDSPDDLYLQFLDEDKGAISDKIDLKPYEMGDGNFSYEFNTSLSGLEGGRNYYMQFTGNLAGYTEPEPLEERFYVNTTQTELLFLNYTDDDRELPSNTISEYWNETVNITLYFGEVATDWGIDDAEITYSWTYDSGVAEAQQDKGAGYYTLTFNGSKALETKSVEIKIKAKRNNFTTIEENFFVDVKERPTLINEKSLRERIYRQIYVQDSVNFTFSYIDSLTGKNLTEIGEAYYEWERYTSEGEIADEGIGDLQVKNKQFILDFNTSSQPVGEYFMIVHFKKEHFKAKTATISLVINKREISANLGDNFQDGKLDVVQGDEIQIKVTLQDPTREDVPLTNASVTLRIGEHIYEFQETNDGTYIYELSTEDYETFFTSETLTGNINITKENYIEESIQISIVIGMVEGPIPGIPTFYFLMVVGALVAVVGSLVVYRGIQKARIPTFIKKTDKMKKAIKSRKEISESVLYPSKDEFIVKELDERWEKLGLSLSDVLGVERKRGKEISKDKGGAK
ncbi:MAG: hypothetical protein ACOC4M_03820 [Promethearchaeia archaeon]